MRTHEQARAYAAEVRERNKPPCDCETCVQLRLLPMVQRILEQARKNTLT